MSEKATEKNIAHLVKLLKNPDRQVHFEIEEQSIELCKAYEEASCNTAELEAVVPVSIDELPVTSTASILFSQIPQQGPSITTANKIIL